ncbi:hypothetical protein AB1N83_005904 [Pleurotus pulmonarius]
MSVSPSAFARSIAPLLLGVIFASPLYGVAVAQGIAYYRNYRRDPKFVKYSIALLLLIDSAHTFSLANATIVWYLRAEPDAQYTIGMLVSTFLSYVTTAFVQSAFTLRVWILYGKRWLIPSILGIFVLFQLVGGLGMSSNMVATGQLSGMHDTISIGFGCLELVSAMICDIMISSTLVYFLRTSRSGIKTSDSLIDKLIVYVIGIGALSSVFALLNLLTWLILPDDVIFVIFHSIISKLYVNSLLVTLNSRQRLRHDLNSGTGVDSTKQGGAIALSTFAAT